MANKNTTTPEEAVDQCIPWLKKGALPITIEPGAVNKLRAEHLEQFKKVWDEINWEAHKGKVTDLAEHIGMIARLLAEVPYRPLKVVDWPTLEAARDVVSKRCDGDWPAVKFKYCPGPS